MNYFVTVLRTTDLSCAVVWLPAHWSDVREETPRRHVWRPKPIELEEWKEVRFVNHNSGTTLILHLIL